MIRILIMINRHIFYFNYYFNFNFIDKMEKGFYNKWYFFESQIKERSLSSFNIWRRHLFVSNLRCKQKSYQRYKIGKKFLYWKQILTVKVPLIDSLSIKLILNFAKEWTNINYYLSTYKYNKLPNRDWFWNLVNILTNKEFSKFI